MPDIRGNISLDPGLVAAVIFLFTGVILALFLFTIMWRIYAKAGKPGWSALIPLYNYIVLFEILGESKERVFLLLIPFVNFFVIIKAYFDIAGKFGKSAGFGIGIIFLPYIFLPILAFGDAKYQG